ncbi:MAG: metallophosphoesterase family protein [Gemmatimonadaceae bacterium]|nr:metallophosphoesterase family protein [Gemmatimonadaceae bacterium]
MSVLRIGLISDTHGLVRPDVHTALAGVSQILHAGDVGGQEVLDELALIAPVQAVWGNTDPPGMPGLVEYLSLELGGLRVRVQHGHEVGRPTPERLLATYDEDILVYGHTHRQLVTQSAGRLVVNPGAAGHRRFDLLPSVAVLKIVRGAPSVELIALAG